MGQNNYSLLCPVYEREMKEFAKIVCSINLVSYDYIQIINQNNLKFDDKLTVAIEDADLELTMAILTGYIRQERFCDGLWQKAIREKIFLKLIRRLEELVEKQ